MYLYFLISYISLLNKNYNKFLKYKWKNSSAVDLRINTDGLWFRTYLLIIRFTRCLSHSCR